MKLTPRILVLGFAVAVALTSPERPLRANDGFRVASRRAPVSGSEALRAREVIVQFQEDVDTDGAGRMMRGAGARSARRGVRAGLYLAALDDGFSASETVARLRRTPGVAFAEPNGVVRASLRPNDTFYEDQWNMRMINAERTWDIQKGDASVVVAVLDTGVAYENFGPYRKAPDFGNTTFVPGFDFVNNDDHPNDDNFHGTHVASTIAESTDNNLGVAGLAFGTAIMPVKVLDQFGEGTFFDIVQGIDFAARNPQVKVINLSLGGDDPGNGGQAVRSAVDRAVAAGITIVAAAGNENTGTVSFPASLPNVISVGAVDGRKLRARYSNYGSTLDVVAPGGDVDRDDTGPDGRPDGEPDGILQQAFDPNLAEQGRYDRFSYYWVDGTSQATPHVAAMAALIIRQGITDPAAVQAAIQASAEDLGAAGRDDLYGFGLIRPVIALSGLGLNK